MKSGDSKHVNRALIPDCMNCQVIPWRNDIRPVSRQVFAGFDFLIFYVFVLGLVEEIWDTSVSVKWHALQAFVFVLILLLEKAFENQTDLGYLAALSKNNW